MTDRHPHNRSLRFTATYTSWPFTDAFDDDDPDADYRTRIPPLLHDRLRAWATTFQWEFDETTGEFPTQEHRARFDRRYIELAEELRGIGLDPLLDLWW